MEKGLRALPSRAGRYSINRRTASSSGTKCVVAVSQTMRRERRVASTRISSATNASHVIPETM